MDQSLRRKLCTLEESSLPSAEEVARLAGDDLETLQEIAQNYDGSGTSQGNLLVRRAAADAIEMLQNRG